MDYDSDAGRFVHPGTIVSPSLLEEIKSNVQRNKHAAGITTDDLYKKWPAEEYLPQPVESYHVSQERNDEPKLKGDAESAYTHALMWYITGDEMYAQNVARIIETWSSKLKHFTHESQPCMQGFGWELSFLGRIFSNIPVIRFGLRNWINNSATGWRL